jgi:hypothetical protein
VPLGHLLIAELSRFKFLKSKTILVAATSCDLFHGCARIVRRRFTREERKQDRIALPILRGRFSSKDVTRSVLFPSVRRGYE